MTNKPYKLWTIALRDIIILPSVTTAVFVGRAESVNAITKTLASGEDVMFFVMEKNDKETVDDENDLYKTGTVAKILQHVYLPDGTARLIVKGICGAKVMQYEVDDSASICTITNQKLRNIKDSIDRQASYELLLEMFVYYAKLSKRVSTEDLAEITTSNTGLEDLIYLIIDQLHLTLELKQEILSIIDMSGKFIVTFQMLEDEIAVATAKNKIEEVTKEKFERIQREFSIYEQLKVYQKEGVGGAEGIDDDSKLLTKQIKERNLPLAVIEKLKSEMKRLSYSNPMSSEAGIIRNYIEAVLALPWDVKTKDSSALGKVKKILDRDHYGLDKVKERILEFIAVSNRTKNLKGPILCFVGPPGVGKTSLAKSIAEAIGRKYVKISLGGIKDEAEIRGHRRTYIGAMPGKIINSIKKAKSSNPLLLLDEIDKMSNDYRGDPASAMLEVLDPEQNSEFADHYLELDYDLSDVMFVATANSLDIPPALLDRMEIIKLSGYTQEEKVKIATTHLIPKQLKEHGISKDEFTIADSAITYLIKEYTSEAGVRNLERELSNLMRKTVKNIATKKINSIAITTENLATYAGIPRNYADKLATTDSIGVATGLAYTGVGGDIMFIEALKFAGSGKIKATGKLGQVMKESMQAAFSYVRSQISDVDFNKFDIHIHAPAGATPKDGPSAGIALTAVITSSFLQLPIRHDVAMTGEVTLTGKILPIGGLKEKLLAASRAGVKHVIIPKANEKDLLDLPVAVTSNLAKNLKITTVSTINEALPLIINGFSNRDLNFMKDAAALRNLITAHQH